METEMTPEFLTGLGLLLLEFGHWLEDERPGTIDVALVAAVVELVGEERKRLTGAGAR